MKASTKKKLKKFLVGALAALALIGTTAMIGNLSDGFKNLNPKDWEILQANENNLILKDALDDKVKSETGFIVTTKNGVVSLTGKNNGVYNDTVKLGTIKLPAGTYTFTTAKDGVNDGTTTFTYYMSLTDDAGTVNMIADNEAIVVTEETEYNISVTVAADQKVDGIKLYPVIVEGEDAEGFYQTSEKED